MISLKLMERLKLIKESKKIPNVFFITGLYDQEKKTQFLTDVVKTLEENEVSEIKGNIIVLDSGPSNFIKVDDVRDLLKKISLRNWNPSSGRYVLVPRAELLTVQSSNALLKSLEESPHGTYFILGAPSKRNVLKTILSRSFILNGESNKSFTQKENNIFEEAFFNKNFEPFLKISKENLKNEWEGFSSQLREKFTQKVYSGELNRNEWYRFFDFMEGLNEKIESNMDTKWLVSSIERFEFNG